MREPCRARGCGVAPSRLGWRSVWSQAGRRGGSPIGGGARAAQARWRQRVRVSLRHSLGLSAILAVAAAQAPNYRVTYRLRVLEGAAPATRLLATAVVSGPPETDLRLSLHAAALEIQALLGPLPEPDTVNLAGLFYTRPEAGRSRRGLPLWEEDSYRRWARVALGGATRLYPFGPASVGRRGAVWIRIAVGHQFAARETPAREEGTGIARRIGVT